MVTVGTACCFVATALAASRQIYPGGGVNTVIPNGPSNTYQAESRTIAEFLRVSILDIP